jgi:hypothetical protein
LSAEKTNGWPPQIFTRGVVVHVFKRGYEGGNHFLIIHIISTEGPLRDEILTFIAGHFNNVVAFRKALGTERHS